MNACSRRGITLVEMLTVIIIIMILAGILIPTVRIAQKKAEEAGCARNLINIGQALNLYAADWNGRYPTLTGSMLVAEHLDCPWFELLREYGIDGPTWKCPADEGFDPERFTGPEDAQERMLYRADNICYGLNYDVKDRNGRPYRALRTGGWEGQPPDGLPDVITVSDFKAANETIFVAESDGNGKDDFAIDLSGARRIGAKHRGYANVLFADGHVERRPVKPLEGLDINNEYRLWTLALD